MNVARPQKVMKVFGFHVPISKRGTGLFIIYENLYKKWSLFNQFLLKIQNSAFHKLF